MPVYNAPTLALYSSAPDRHCAPAIPGTIRPRVIHMHMFRRTMHEPVCKCMRHSQRKTSSRVVLSSKRIAQWKVPDGSAAFRKPYITTTSLGIERFLFQNSRGHFTQIIARTNSGTIYGLLIQLSSSRYTGKVTLDRSTLRYRGITDK